MKQCTRDWISKWLQVNFLNQNKLEKKKTCWLRNISRTQTGNETRQVWSRSVTIPIYTLTKSEAVNHLKKMGEWKKQKKNGQKRRGHLRSCTARGSLSFQRGARRLPPPRPAIAAAAAAALHKISFFFPPEETKLLLSPPLFFAFRKSSFRPVRGYISFW